MELIINHSPDILGLQEVTFKQLQFIENSLKEKKLNFSWIGEASLGGEKGEFVPIFINTDKLQVKESGTFWLSNDSAQKGSKVFDSVATRICSWCKLVEKSKLDDQDSEFLVANTHWDQGREARYFSANKMRDEIENLTDIGNMPSIVLGDFNCTSSSDDLKLFCSGIDNVKNLITPKEDRKEIQSDDDEIPFQVVIGEKICQEENKLLKEESFIGTKLKKPTTVDFILVSQEIIVKTYSIPSDTLCSTHRPVISDIIIV